LFFEILKAGLLTHEVLEDADVGIECDQCDALYITEVIDELVESLARGRHHQG